MAKWGPCGDGNDDEDGEDDGGDGDNDAGPPGPPAPRGPSCAAVTPDPDRFSVPADLVGLLDEGTAMHDPYHEAAPSPVAVNPIKSEQPLAHAPTSGPVDSFWEGAESGQLAAPVEAPTECADSLGSVLNASLVEAKPVEPLPSVAPTPSADQPLEAISGGAPVKALSIDSPSGTATPEKRKTPNPAALKLACDEAGPLSHVPDVPAPLPPPAAARPPAPCTAGAECDEGGSLSHVPAVPAPLPPCATAPPPAPRTAGAETATKLARMQELRTPAEFIAEITFASICYQTQSYTAPF